MAILSSATQHKIEQLLVEQKLISEPRLKEAKNQAVQNNKPLLVELLAQKLLNEEEMTKIVATANSVPYVNLTSSRIDKEVLKLLPREIAQRYMSVPIGSMGTRLVVAMLDPSNLQAVDYLSRKIARPLSVYMASESGITNVLSQYAPDVKADVQNAIDTTLTDSAAAGAAAGKKTIATLVQDSPISRALSAILEYAVNARASDVHIEPAEHELKIRCRVDGILKEIMTLPKSIEPALISRVKILSNTKIDEHRIPQDGQFQITTRNKDIDIRVAISPVVWGEQIVLRLLDKGDKALTLNDLGIRGHALELLQTSARRPHGMILATGPTGSGKSTTLYTVLQMIRDVSINIVTLEDPVERKIDGVNQIEVDPAVGLTFATGLRSILRQDPDVVFVGEIRDKETATLAVQAALTGHLVLSTLHTNSAGGVLPRLLDMEIEPFLIASTVNTIIGQRLVRRIANPEEYQSSLAETKAIQRTLSSVLPTTKAAALKRSQDYGYQNLPLADQNAYTLFKGKTSPETPDGYRGRMGIYEVFNMSEELEKLLVNHATSGQIQTQAIKEGMLTMRQDGYLKALNGQTTLEEVERVAADE